MTESRRNQLVLAALLLLGGLVFFTGEGWGLASRGVDTYLFGAADRAWSGAEILQKGGTWTPDPKRAADADTGPAMDRQRLQWLNQTDKQQAEIIRRYRLFSAQPDEMVTFMALAGMRGGGFDPRMYQYGGVLGFPGGGLVQGGAVGGVLGG